MEEVEVNVDGQWRPEGRGGRWRTVDEDPAAADAADAASHAVRLSLTLPALPPIERTPCGSRLSADRPVSISSSRPYMPARLNGASFGSLTSSSSSTVLINCCTRDHGAVLTQHARVLGGRRARTALWR